MALTSAERQRQYRQRLLAKAREVDNDPTEVSRLRARVAELEAIILTVQAVVQDVPITILAPKRQRRAPAE